MKSFEYIDEIIKESGIVDLNSRQRCLVVDLLGCVADDHYYTIECEEYGVDDDLADAFGSDAEDALYSIIDRITASLEVDGDYDEDDEDNEDLYDVAGYIRNSVGQQIALNHERVMK